jgi:uncharacterized membrane protein YphA (DoxX/SURF4 family)
MMVQVFDQTGFGQWVRIVTALVELVGAGALFVPRLTALAALWLGVTMFCAFLAISSFCTQIRAAPSFCWF